MENTENLEAFGLSAINGQDPRIARKLYLFGRHIAHSLSPVLHNTLCSSLGLPWTLDLLDTDNKEEMTEVMRTDTFIGASITMPHKVAFLHNVDTLTDAGRTIGAINTVFVRKDAATGKRRFIGTNTDCIGIRDSFVYNFPSTAQSAKGKPAAVVGGGGACRAAVFAMIELMGASRVYLVNRDAQEVQDVIRHFESSGLAQKCTWVSTVDQARCLEPTSLVVGCIPDIPPQSEAESRARSIVQTLLSRSRHGVLLDMCYHPAPETALIGLAREAGWDVVYGTEPLFYQAVTQCALWTESSKGSIPIAAAKEAMYARIKERR